MASLLEEMESNQQQNSTPGWNDPPPSIPVQNSTVCNNNRYHLQRLRRPVDPSVQGNPFQSSPQQQNLNTKTTQHGLTATTNTHFHHSRSFPQLNQYGPMSAMGLGTHPGSAFNPTSSTALSNVNSSQSQNSLSPIVQLQPDSVANPPTPQMATIHHPHSNSNLLATSPPSLCNLSSQPAQSITTAMLANPTVESIQQQNSFVTAAPNLGSSQPHYDSSDGELLQQSNLHPNLAPLPNPVAPANFYQNQPQSVVESSASMQQQVLPPQIHNNNGGITSSTTMMAFQQNNEQPINGQLFSPPNIVPLRVDQQCRPTTQPVPNEYRIPVKAAGDVSLSGTQLVSFLTKATLILPQGPMREGIQIRINQLGEFVRAGQISEPCLKKLNFVVDAIDRQIYDEAVQFFEQMLVAYQNDCSLGGWAHGIRLLIQELRVHQQMPNKAHSAGAKQHF